MEYGAIKVARVRHKVLVGLQAGSGAARAQVTRGRAADARLPYFIYNYGRRPETRTCRDFTCYYCDFIHCCCIYYIGCYRFYCLVDFNQWIRLSC